MLGEGLGGRVVEATTQPTGFSPGLAARLLLDDGVRVFRKAGDEDANPDTPGIHRQEARILAHLPAVVPAPRLLWMYDEGGWVALCLEDIDGRHPDEPWTEGDLSLVVAAVKKMAADLTPAPFDPGATAADGFRSTINGWQVALQRGESRLDAWSSGHLTALADLEAEAPGAAAGDTLLHFGEPAATILIPGDRVPLVDSPSPRLAPAPPPLVALPPTTALQPGPA